MWVARDDGELKQTFLYQRRPYWSTKDKMWIPQSGRPNYHSVVVGIDTGLKPGTIANIKLIKDRKE